MIKSMTGFGSAKGIAAGLPVSIELRSVNNRYLDLNIKLPRGFLFAEAAIKTYLQTQISRGKVDIFVSIDSSESDLALIHVNQHLADSYRNAVASIAEEFKINGQISALDLARFPEVLSVQKETLDQELFLSELQPVIQTALLDFNEMRVREGRKLASDIMEKADTIEHLVNSIEESAPETVAAYQERLRSKLQDIFKDTTLSEERILAEAAIFADKTATDEETVRLHSHLSQFRKMVSAGSPIGRKLDFLIQEFNREANTIASKCQDSEISYRVVEMKSEIEKIREQIQNIE